MIYNFPFMTNPYYRRQLPQNQYTNKYNRKSYYNNFNNYTDSHHIAYSNNSINYDKNFLYTATKDQLNSANNTIMSKKNFEKTEKITSENTIEPDFFEILGLKLYFDDILLICLLFFLYNEGVKDQYLFISLILLLIS